MAPVLIDTDILSRFFRRDLKVVARFFGMLPGVMLEDWTL